MENFISQIKVYQDGVWNRSFLRTSSRAYLLHKIEFHENDTLIDCGSNVGELIPYFYKKYPNLNYIAFEPDRGF